MVTRLPFTLLPHGTWNIHDVLANIRKQSASFPTEVRGRRIDESRLEQIASLGPQRCYIGKESWSGYVVLEFDPATPVLLECPFENNALYILTGDWQAMVIGGVFTPATMSHNRFHTSDDSLGRKTEDNCDIRRPNLNP